MNVLYLVRAGFVPLVVVRTALRVLTAGQRRNRGKKKKMLRDTEMSDMKEPVGKNSSSSSCCLRISPRFFSCYVFRKNTTAELVRCRAELYKRLKLKLWVQFTSTCWTGGLRQQGENTTCDLISSDRVGFSRRSDDANMLVSNRLLHTDLLTSV